MSDEITDDMKEAMARQVQDFFDRCETGISPVGDTEFEWSETGTGFGRFRFYVGMDHKVHCANECMSKEWIKRMLCHMVDECVLDEP